MIADRTGIQRETILELGIKDIDAALDIGCGNGEKTFFISQHVKRAVGIDPDKKMIAAAQNKYDRKNLSFQVGEAESLKFPSSAFNAVLFTESFHHIPVEKQAETLRESYRVLEPNGKLLITEPVNDSGSFEEILKFYDEERALRRCALKTIEACGDTGFRINVKKEIHVEYTFKGFSDLYQNNIITKPHAAWKESDRQHIIDILNRCDKTVAGDYIIDYLATVWVLTKISPSR